MKASDVMTAKVIAVGAETPVEEIARLLLERNISAVPVVDGESRLLGIVSEGDLLRRPELGTERRRSWWLGLFTGPDEAKLREFIKSHGRRAEDVMTRQVVTVTEDAPLGEVAASLERHRVKRVPVVRDGKVVGIVSRANLVQALAAYKPELPAAGAPDDAEIKRRIEDRLEGEGWLTHGALNVTVQQGSVELWGWAESEEERRAIRLAVEGVPGVRQVEDHIGMVAPYLRGS